jgi:hypothetical protein
MPAKAGIHPISVIFTLMKLLQRDSEPLKGQVLRYDRGITDQFNSTVTYASIAFCSICQGRVSILKNLKMDSRLKMSGMTDMGDNSLLVF